MRIDADLRELGEGFAEVGGVLWEKSLSDCLRSDPSFCRGVPIAGLLESIEAPESEQCGRGDEVELQYGRRDGRGKKHTEDSNGTDLPL